MDLIKLQSKRGIVSFILRILFDAMFVAAVLLSIVVLGQPIIAIGLVLLSKWRTFFVRPRFWWVNILSNLTDVIFGLGIVTLIYFAPGFWQQVAAAALYLLWNIFIKPGSKRVYIIIQAAASQFLGVWALFMVAHMSWLPVVVLVNFVIGFVTARHILADYEEDSQTLLAMVWGIILAEVGFLAYHWTLTYNLFGIVSIPQVAIVDLLLGVIVLAIYDSYSKNSGKFKWDDIRWPVIFATLLVIVIAIIFSGLL
jgi:hypothetical protein